MAAWYVFLGTVTMTTPEALAVHLDELVDGRITITREVSRLILRAWNCAQRFAHTHTRDLPLPQIARAANRLGSWVAAQTGATPAADPAVLAEVSAPKR